MEEVGPPRGKGFRELPLLGRKRMSMEGGRSNRELRSGMKTE